MADGRPWIIGESPSRSGDRYHRFPLSGAPAKTLCQAAGWPPDGDGRHLRDWTWALYGRFVTANVFVRYAQATPWRLPEARARAAALRENMIREGAPCAILLGRRVGQAFDMAGYDFFVWSDGPLPMVVIPHPSGRNLLMNDGAIRERIGMTLREAAAWQAAA